MTEEITELEILRRQVYTLEHSESTALVEKIFQHTRTAEELAEANTKIERLEEELRLANEDARTANLALDKAEEMLKQAEQALTELKKIDLIGPLTAEEWLEFRLRREEDEDHELLRCCANTSAIRDDIFHLMRSYAEDPLLGAGPIIRIREAIVDHGQLLDPGHPAGRRLAELLDKMSDYYRRELV